MHVIPAILTKDFEEFLSQIQKLTPYYTRFQIDIADGEFVPNTTLQLREIAKAMGGRVDRAPDTRAAERALAGGKRGQDPLLIFDIHLMVNDLEKEIVQLEQLSPFVKIGVIFIHASRPQSERGSLRHSAEAARSPNYQLLTTKYPRYSFGLVLNPEDSVNTIQSNYDLSFIKHIQIMTIIPGFQGQSFIPETLTKVEQLRTINYGLKIYLDGAMNDQTIPLIQQLKIKPDFLSIGSFLTHAENVEERVKYLRTVTDPLE